MATGNSNVQIDISANNTASPVIKQVAGDIDGLEQSTHGASKATAEQTGSVVSLNAALEIAEKAVQLVGEAYTVTVGEAQKYDQIIYDVMLSTGANAEEASRLVQVIDDVGIEYGTLKTAMKMASKEGIEPNIQSLAKLSDEYLKLAPGVERNQFLMDKFGKSGLDMARAMEKGGDALIRMNNEIEGGLILTQDAIDESEDYRENIDNLEDSVMGLKISMGNNFIPVLNQVIDGMNYAAQGQDDYNRRLQASISAHGDLGDRMNNIHVLMMQQGETVNSSVVSYTAMAEAYAATTTSADELIIATETLASVDASAVKGAIQVSVEYEKQGEKMVALQSDHDALIVKKQELIAQGWQPESDKITEVNSKLAENEAKQLSLTEAINGTIGAMILQTAAAGLDAEGQLALARATGEIDEATYAALTAQGILKQQYEDGAIDAQEYARQTIILRDAVNSLKDKTVNITVNSIANQVAAANTIANLNAAGFFPTGYADGGISTGPTSGHLELLHGTEAVIPLQNGSIPVQMQSSGTGGTVNLYMTVTSAVSIADEQHAQSVLYPFMEEAVSRLKAEGKL